MSRFCGKCDFKDHIDIFEMEHVLNSTIYVGRDGPLKITCEEDCIPYYTHLITMSAGNKEGAVIHLTKESFIDREEAEILDFDLKYMIRAYNSAKRKHKEFTLDDAKKQFWNFDREKALYTELYNRVIKDKNKATTEGLHLPFKNWERKELVNYAKEHNMEKHPIIREMIYKIEEFEKLEGKSEN